MPDIYSPFVLDCTTRHSRSFRVAGYRRSEQEARVFASWPVDASACSVASAVL